MPMVSNYFCLMVKFTLNYLLSTCQLILTCEIAKITSHSPVAKRCLEKYCSCDQACQFSASYGTPCRSNFENLTIDDKFINKRVRLFREEKIISTS